jgi:hypothetical protein
MNYNMDWLIVGCEFVSNGVCESRLHQGITYLGLTPI